MESKISYVIWLLVVVVGVISRGARCQVSNCNYNLNFVGFHLNFYDKPPRVAGISSFFVNNIIFNYVSKFQIASIV